MIGLKNLKKSALTYDKRLSGQRDDLRGKQSRQAWLRYKDGKFGVETTIILRLSTV